MNILVTGANGQLGNEMRLISHTSEDCFIFTDVNQVEGVETTYLDITDLTSVRQFVQQNDVNVIVNCAAYNNVEAAETNVELAEKLNAEAPENLALAMKEVDGLLVHVSSDYVFGAGSYNTPCREDQECSPVCAYAKSKFHGEQKVAAVGGKYVIIRTSWLYSKFGKNFCKTMMNLTATKPELKVVFDQVGTPTFARDLAKAIEVILSKFDGSQTGVYHYSNEGVCSWYDFAKMIASYSGNTECKIYPCHSDAFPSTVVRPPYSVLDKTKIKTVFAVEVPYWTESLKECMSQM